ncbi:TIGR02281 family clan AA aspartic protease [Aliiglaciecola sp. CAU 1673]|uniref:retropepsin-like aspartic protease family protein n=1 Tax=Aliiglaciecola sp. CAU 1673 TaxID=3032595 RepID=UPI0023DB6CD4|nr:TIGR02281 family clan AA aspartic protease [Aliiglaciecola sp. CAU 1673]MDF2178415.1 TIGR02281 family clan AA aspartic protease [Aliiglaciecola sp. CAU 1673]
MGKWMMVLAWVAALGLLTLWFDDELNKQFNPNAEPLSYRQDTATEVKLKRNRQGHYVSGGFINGVPVTFLLDTGATQVSIPAHLGHKLGLSAGHSQRVLTANGTVNVSSTTVGELQLGDILLNNISANLNPGMGGDEILLGMSALKQLEFTQRGDWLTLRYHLGSSDSF